MNEDYILIFQKMAELEGEQERTLALSKEAFKYNTGNTGVFLDEFTKFL